VAARGNGQADLAPPGEISDIAAQFVPSDVPEIENMDLERATIRVTMLENIPSILVGHTGVAKTKLLQRMHMDAQWPYRSVPGYGGVESETLIGKWIATKEKGMTWAHGILPFCMKNGIAIGFQEVNYVAPEVLVLLHEYLDEGYITLMELPVDHEDFIIRPHENFRFYGTMNPPELYPGARDLSPAFLRRCLVRRVDPLDAVTEAKVVHDQTGIDFDTAAQMAGVASSVRQQFDNNLGLFWVSTADLVTWARLTKHMDPLQAAEIAIIGKAPENEVPFVRGRVRISFEPNAPEQPVF
jgi:MoxR-like ATPase